MSIGLGPIPTFMRFYGTVGPGRKNPDPMSILLADNFPDTRSLIAFLLESGTDRLKVGKFPLGEALRGRNSKYI